MQYKFIIDKPCSPVFNMAADLFMLHECERRDIVYVRLYRWLTPAITLGCMQNPNKNLDYNAMSTDGISHISRPTGGRAIYHDGDITYSIAFSQPSLLLGNSIIETYRKISEIFLSALNILGVFADTSDTSISSEMSRREIKLPCFIAPNRDEILVNGCKLIGSAQKRTNNAVLQHGSIPITNAFRKLPQYLAIDDQKKSEYTKLLKEKAVALSECYEFIDIGSVEKAILLAFQEGLSSRLIPTVWGETELKSINELT